MVSRPTLALKRSHGKIGASRRKPPDPCKEWRRQMAICQDFIARLKVTPAMHGQKWKDKMLAYHGRLLEELKKARPKGCK